MREYNYITYYSWLMLTLQKCDRHSRCDVAAKIDGGWRAVFVVVTRRFIISLFITLIPTSTSIIPTSIIILTLAIDNDNPLDALRIIHLHHKKYSLHHLHVETKNKSPNLNFCYLSFVRSISIFLIFIS